MIGGSQIKPCLEVGIRLLHIDSWVGGELLRATSHSPTDILKSKITCRRLEPQQNRLCAALKGLFFYVLE